MNQLQLLSIKTLNSPYKFILNILIYLIIYVCITGKLFYTAECMQENTIPSVAEAKPSIVSKTPVNTKSIMQREINSFIGYIETIEEQKKIITKQHAQIETLVDAKQEVNSKRLYLAKRFQEVEAKNQQTETENKQLNNVLTHTREARVRNIRELEETKRQLVEKDMVLKQIVTNQQKNEREAFGAGLTVGAVGLLSGLILASYLGNNIDIKGAVNSIKELLQIKR